MVDKEFFIYFLNRHCQEQYRDVYSAEGEILKTVISMMRWEEAEVITLNPERWTMTVRHLPALAHSLYILEL